MDGKPPSKKEVTAAELVKRVLAVDYHRLDGATGRSNEPDWQLLREGQPVGVLEVTTLVNSDALVHAARMNDAMGAGFTVPGVVSDWIITIRDDVHEARELRARLEAQLPALDSSELQESTSDEWAAAESLHVARRDDMLAQFHPELARAPYGIRQLALELHRDFGISALRRAAPVDGGRVAFIHMGGGTFGRNHVRGYLIDDILKRADNQSKLSRYAGVRALLVYLGGLAALAVKEPGGALGAPDPVDLPSWVTDVFMVDERGEGWHVTPSGWSVITAT